MNASFECIRPIPLGAENGILPDSSFSATSQTTSREAHKARLNGQFGNKIFTNLSYMRLI